MQRLRVINEDSDTQSWQKFTIDNVKYAKKTVRILRNREHICIHKKEKPGSKEAVSNWVQILKVFPKEMMAETPLEYFLLYEEDNSDEMQIPNHDQITR
jgi:hypothetical protein